MPACGGQVRWDKAGTDDASLGSDLNGCRATAHSATQRMYGPPVPQMSSGLGPFGGPSSTEPTLADRQMREQQAVDRCMREKGYTLVPVAR